MTNQVATAPFGRTGHDSSRVIFGAAALGGMRQDRADEVLATLLEFGVNHIDTAASYGESELRVGPWMAEHRADFFLATKTGERTGRPAPVPSSSARSSGCRWTRSTSSSSTTWSSRRSGRWRTGRGARSRRWPRRGTRASPGYIGVTGHGTRIAGMHLRSLERFTFDSVLLPYSFVALQSDAYRADVEALLAVCAERQVAVQTIKSVARRRWPADYDGPRFSWYQPIADADAARPGGALGARQPAGVPQHVERRRPPAHPSLEAPPRQRARPTDAEMQADVDALGIEPLFDGADLERI